MKWKSCFAGMTTPYSKSTAFCVPLNLRCTRLSNVDKRCSKQPVRILFPYATATRPPPAGSVKSASPKQEPELKKEPAQNDDQDPFPTNAVPYFAYFANMNPRKIGPLSTISRRRFPIIRTEPAILNSYRVAFTAPGLPLEPAFANLERFPKSQVHGVVHWITPADFDTLARTELAIDVRGPFRQIVEPLLSRIVTVDVVVNGTIVKARTFIFPAFAPSWAKPSRRYVMVALEGARYWGLDQGYIDNVLAKIEYEKGVLGGFGLYTEPRPHLLDRPNPMERFGNANSELYSPYKQIRAKEAIENFEASNSVANDDRIRLVPVSKYSIGSRPLYFFPGLDGNGRGILSQVYDIEQEGVYNLKSFVYPSQNKDSLESIVSQVLDMISNDAGSQPVSIVSESMGGVISLLFAIENLRRKERNTSEHSVDIDLMLMINPATSYVRSNPRELWDFMLGLELPDEAYRFLLTPLLLPALLDFDSATTGITPEHAPRLVRVLQSLNRLPDLLPRSTMEHRITLLSQLKIRDEEVRQLSGPNGPKNIALICAINDNLIPSFAESYRLRRILPKLYTAILPFGGHSPMFDRRFSLASFLHPFAKLSSLESRKVTKKEPSEAVMRRREAIRKKFGGRKDDAKRKQSRAEIRQLRDFVAESIRAYAPVFIGEENIPPFEEGKPVLFVSNHTLLGWVDGSLPLLRIWDNHGVLMRALAHPVLFRQGNIQFPGTTIAQPEDSRKIGIRETSPQALLEFLSIGQWILLFPGGAQEALKESEKDKYSVRWPSDPEFVRACALFGATIIPVSTVGTEDSVRILAGPETTKQVVETGARILRQNFDFTLARDDAKKWKGESDVPIVLPPLMIPNGNDRVYFRFGKPIDVPEECLSDKSLEKSFYERARRGVEEGIEILLRRREKDEFRMNDRRKRFRQKYGDEVPPPAALGWTWMRGEDSYLDEDLQPPL